MLESFLIALREGFEAALVISIALAYVRRHGDTRARRWIWIGVGAALVTSTVAGVVLHLAIDGLTGTARGRTFAAICAAAAALLTWMIFWMATNGRRLKADLERRAATALAEGSAVGLVAVAFTAVMREGLETALFLVSTTVSADGALVAAGTVLGLVAASGLGALVYRGSQRVSTRRFFQVTGVVIIVFAAGLVAKTVLLLQSSGDLGTVNGAVYDLTRFRFLTLATQPGRFLAGIFGWDPRPSIEELLAYIAYAVPVAWAYLRATTRGAPRRVASAST